jgi:formylglycine-generating enzyme required for sulfatase activity
MFLQPVVANTLKRLWKKIPFSPGHSRGLKGKADGTRRSRGILAVGLGCLLWSCLVGNPSHAEITRQLPSSLKNNLDMTLRLIPGGIYLLGSPPEEAGRYWHEGPQHKVQLSPFYITEKEVTNAQYGQFLAATGYPAPVYWSDKNLNAPGQPVVGVTWHDAAAFADWLSGLTGQKYRLPTEAEWETACRGGLTGQSFPWGSHPPEQGRRFLANYNPNPYDKDGFRFPAPVGSFPPNGLGLFDMAGNVAEWCGDWYDPNFYASGPGENPLGPSKGIYRIIRGGSWYARGRELRCAARQYFRPSRADGFIGFRLVNPVSP